MLHGEILHHRRRAICLRRRRLVSPAFIRGGLPPGIPRTYVVHAKNPAGTGPDAGEISATPESAPITDEEIRTSTLSFSGPTADSGNRAMAIAAPVIGHTYRIQHSPDLAAESWQDFGDPQAGNGGTLEIVLPVTLAEEQGFSRILIMH